MSLKQLVPILDWLPNYKRAWLKGDLAAGITVGFMLIPQGMAYAMLAGMPPIYGLYSAIVPMLVYAIFGTSRSLSVGPVAMDSLLIASGLGALALPPEAYIPAAILLAFLVGLAQFLAGTMRLGFLVNFLAQPVISGFTSAAAIVITASQLTHLLGYPVIKSNYLHELLWSALQNIGLLHLPTFLFSVLGMVLILGLRKWNKAIPGALVAVVLATLAVWVFDLKAVGIKVVGEVPGGLPAPILPTFDWQLAKDLLPTVFTLTLVAYMEAYSVGKALELKRKDHMIHPNQELRALGLANMLGSIFQSFPTAGGFSRTAVNNQSGAKTALAGLFSATFVAVALLFFTPLFRDLPQAILASVIMVAVIGLVDLKAPIRLWKQDRIDFMLLLTTFFVTVVFGIMPGIGAGVLLSLVMVVFRAAAPHIAVLGQLPGTMHFRNIERFPEAVQRPEVLAVRLDSQLFFANSAYFRDHLMQEAAKKGKALRMVLIDAESISFLDSTAIEMLRSLLAESKARNLYLFISGAKGPVRDAMYRSGLMQEIGAENMFVHASEAMEAWEQVLHGNGHEVDARAMQHNLRRREARLARRKAQ